MKELRKKLRQLRALIAGGGRIRKHELQPVRDWLVLLAVSFLTLLMLCGYGLYRFNAKDSISDVGGHSTALGAFDRTLLEETVKSYRDRAVRFETLRTSPEPAPDPGATRVLSPSLEEQTDGVASSEPIPEPGQ